MGLRYETDAKSLNPVLNPRLNPWADDPVAEAA
jgi:hypothetical protein